ncbi:hypothetical protein Q7P37_007687 [Cladosporium fusiforme]
MHPFDPLTPDEISRAATIVRPHFGQQDPQINFRVITLQEPPKQQMIPYLDHEHHRTHEKAKRPARRARVEVVVELPEEKNALFELLVDLDSEKVIAKQHHRGKHSYIDAAYMQQVEAACLADERVQEQIRLLDLPAGSQTVVEPWAYATDGQNDMSQRLSMCWFYLRLTPNKDANYYAYPLDLCAEVSEDLLVVKIYRLPTRPNEEIHNSPRPFDRRRIHPQTLSEYHPDLRPSPRTTTKPYQVVQPDGPSFSVQGHRVAWEKWTFRVGFNYREGLTLHDINYDNRSLFYRLSLAEMFVPYGDPRAPYPRKAAFDLGNDGAGINANNLRLGCDCLGTIKYFSFHHNSPSGQAEPLANVVCMHEQDDGLMWKHTNFRTQHAVVARARILVLQTIITVSNYEYIFAFHFGQDAEIRFEVRATGILSTVPAAVEQESPIPYGTRVAPGVLAPYHQHLFSLRIDPALDGHANSLAVEESHALPTSSTTNPHGVGYVSHSTYIAHESGHDLNISANRVFKIVNEGILNPTTRTPVGYKLVPAPSQLLLADPASFHAKRSEFAQHAVWVTRYADDELWPAGKYTMQSGGGEGIASAIARRAGEGSQGGTGDGACSSVRNTSIVLWHTFGSTHNPRIEDWPVMPCEKMSVALKPVNFFSGNPGLDVAPSTQERNRSVLYDEGREVDDPAAAECCKAKL